MNCSGPATPGDGPPRCGTAEHFGTRDAAARGGRARGPAGSAALAFAERDGAAVVTAAYDAAIYAQVYAIRTKEAQTHRKQRHKWPRDIAAHPDDAHKVGSPEGACGDLANVTGSPGLIARGNGNKGPGYGVGDIVFTRRYEG